MPPKSLSPKRSCPISIDEEDILYIERAGVGKNFSEKARSIIRRARGEHDILAKYEDAHLTCSRPGATCVYFEHDGEKLWAEEIPFEFDKKDGWKGIAAIAVSAGYLVQPIVNDEIGMVAIWVAPATVSKNCDTCRKKVLEAMQ